MDSVEEVALGLASQEQCEGCREEALGVARWTVVARPLHVRYLLHTA